MDINKKKLMNYIDTMNEEKRPKLKSFRRGEGRLKSSDKTDIAKLMYTVRRVRSLRQPVMPDHNYEQRLINAIRAAENKKETKNQSDTNMENSISITYRKGASRLVRRTLIGVTAAAAAAALLYIIPKISLPVREDNIAYAMEQAYQELKAYHGTIEAVETNAAGEMLLQSKREVWADQEGNYYLKELKGYLEGTITVNNTSKEWQIRPEENKVYLSAAFPDPYRFTFELGREVEEVKNALSVKIIGEEIISGRTTILLEITPDGGETYHLWVDKKTELPLKKQTAMQNAVQYTVTFTDISFEDMIPQELLAYHLPKGYEVVELQPEQPVTGLEEAADILEFTPIISENIPNNYELKGISILTDTMTLKMYYKVSGQGDTVILLQSKATEELKPTSDAAIGTVNGITAEFLNRYEGVKGVRSIRWRQEGIEYRVYGNIAMEALADIAQGLTASEIRLPKDVQEENKPEVEVPVDLAVEENDQKSADAGHSPWKLDPVFVAHVYANLLISPNGIEGEYPIPYDAVTIISNDGIEAIVRIESNKSIADKIYLKRLVRQDETGIWTVVGYDPVQ